MRFKVMRNVRVKAGNEKKSHEFFVSSWVKKTNEIALRSDTLKIIS
jgi:hypothetical protein